MKDRIKQYLADGLKPSQIASVVGCSPAYISQLLKDPEFASAVEALKIDQNKDGDQILEVKYESLEHKLVDEIHNRLGEAEFAQLGKTLESVTKAREAQSKRRNPAAYVQNAPVVVPILIPAHAIQAPVLRLNEQSEVVAIDNKPLAPLSATGVKQLFSKLSGKDMENPHAALASSIQAQPAKQRVPQDF